MPPHLVQEIGSQFSTRIEGTCIKHHFGKSTVKMYDKFARVLRLETTTNNVSAFKHHRKVEHRHGPSTRRIAPVKKSIYSLRDLQDILLGCNRRYLAHLSALDDFSAGARALDQLTRPRRADGKTIKPINFFNRMEQTVLRALQCPASAIAGLRRADLIPHLTDVSPAAISRYISRLRQLGLLKRVHGTYRYYLTKIGRAAVAACSHITENVLIPALA
jgi:DNA-binding MarR family transcriptional regulator